jgi:hypothetical protein
MNAVAYKSELFDVLKDLTAINNQVIFEKQDDKVMIRRSDAESTIAYQLLAPKEYFAFDEEKLAFYNYMEFYQYFRAINTPEIFIDGAKIFIKSGSAKVDYILSNPESIQAGPKSINFKSPDIKFCLSSADHDELMKMINLIKPKKAQITSNGENVKVKLFNNLHDNTFEKTFDIENVSKNKDEIDFVIFSETFENIPLKRDYTIEIKKEGFIKISLVDENLSLDIYTGKIKQ